MFFSSVLRMRFNSFISSPQKPGSRAVGGEKGGRGAMGDGKVKRASGSGRRGAMGMGR